jgi:two-component system sensor histidine kinase GlrK
MAGEGGDAGVAEPLEEHGVRLTLFWRIVLTQASLIIGIVAVNFYALAQLHHLTGLNAEILAADTAVIEEGKRSLRIFLSQMRSAEKYVLLQDKTFLDHFVDGRQEFARAVERLAPLLATARERELLAHIRDLYARYDSAFATALSPKSAWGTVKAELGDAIASRLNELIRIREEMIAQKTATARDKASAAADVVGWLTLAGIGVAVSLSYINARRVSHPLKRLVRELHLVGKGEFRRHVDVRSPAEVAELMRAFNWMAARLAKLDEMKEGFIAHISHELRTPLTAIREGTALLQEEIPGPLSAAQREVVDIVRDHCERLYRFLSSVLDLSKMEAGMMEYIRVPSDLRAMLERSVQMVQLSAQRKGIRLEVVCSSALPLVSVDEGRMQQVFDNLLSNALKFTPPGGIIRVSAACEGEARRGGPWVEIRVSDTGIGIPADEVERVFEKFYQSPQHRQEGGRGTGLGLAIARHVVEAHGGRIWAESQVGRGSTFIILLPLPAEMRPAPAMRRAEMPAHRPAALPVSDEGARHAVP